MAGWRWITVCGFCHRWFRFSVLLGSFCRAIFFAPAALERQEMVPGPGELEVEGDFVTVECVVLGCGLQDSSGSHGRIGGFRNEAGHGCVQEIGLCLDYLELSPAGDGHGVDQVGFDSVAGVKVGYETLAKLDEGGRGILAQRWVGRGKAVAGAVARGVAFAVGGDGSSGTSAVGAGGFDLV